MHGTESLVREFFHRLNSSAESMVSLHLNHRLIALSHRPDGKILLEFKNGHSYAAHKIADHTASDHSTVKVLARHVVLALPRSPLLQLRPILPEHVGEFVDSVIPIPLVKCFLSMKIPSGKGPHSHRHTPLPHQQGRFTILSGRMGIVNAEWSWSTANSPAYITGCHSYSKKNTKKQS